MNGFTDIVSKVMEVRPDEGDYTGEDGLLYCGKCRTPKEAYFEDGHAALFGRDRHPANCACRQKQLDEQALAEQLRKHDNTVKALKQDCFDTPKLRDWCFENDNGANPQMKHARFYADHFDKMLADNIGYLQSDDGKYLIMGNGTRAFAVLAQQPEKENPLRTAEMTLEDDYGMIDGVINNGRRGEELEKAQEHAERTKPEKPSIRERLEDAKRECAGHKAPEVKKPGCDEPEQDCL